MDDLEYSLERFLEEDAEWDWKCSESPKCSCCGDPVLQYDEYLEYDGIILCEQCMKNHRKYSDNLEV